MITRMTWIPDNGQPETLTVDVPEAWISEFPKLVGTPEWANSEAVAWIPCRSHDSEPMTKRLFRLAQITSLKPDAANLINPAAIGRDAEGNPA